MTPLLILWSITLLSVTGEPVKTEESLPPQIIGGSETQIHQYPFQVSLRDENDRHFCGGSLINSQWVLTAVHCLTSLEPFSYQEKSGFVVQLGAHYRNSKVSGEVTAKVSAFYYPTSAMSYANHVWKYDIALIKLTAPVNLTMGVIWPVQLPERYFEIRDWENVILIGWGATAVQMFLPGTSVNMCSTNFSPAQDGEYHPWEMPDCGGTALYSNVDVRFIPYALQHTAVPISSRANCDYSVSMDNHNARMQLESKDLICVGTPQSTSCFGDSGGPMVKFVNGNWVQYGVTSYGSGRCAPDLSKYTKVSWYVDWINSIITRY